MILIAAGMLQAVAWIPVLQLQQKKESHSAAEQEETLLKVGLGDENLISA